MPERDLVIRRVPHPFAAFAKGGKSLIASFVLLGFKNVAVLRASASVVKIPASLPLWDEMHGKLHAFPHFGI